MADWLLVVAKAVHIIALSLWVAGLVALALLMMRYRPNLPESRFIRFRKLTHYGYVRFLGPVAVVAIGAGTLLVLLIGGGGPWLFLKLLLVSALACVHAYIGHMIVQTATTGGSVRLPPAQPMLVLVCLLALAIVSVVLVKPSLRVAWPDWLLQPQERALPSLPVLSSPRAVPI